MRGLAFGLVAACLAGAAAAASDVRDVDAVPAVRERGREAYAAFLAAPAPRAFAVGERGPTGWRSGEATKSLAIAGALYGCNKLARDVCRIYAVNDEVVYPQYAQFEQKSARMLQALREASFAFADYGDEVQDFRVTSAELRRDTNLQADTPLAVPGVRTIKAVDLARMMGSAVKPLVIDVIEDDGHETLPGARWIRGAGLGPREDDVNADIRERLGFVLEGLSGSNKSALIAFFCGDARCWLSLNAALRARDLGYTNVLWYRGGINAWKAARLESLEAVQFGQVR
jgi:PQQ-dependent catabolism-associated CXXCW motif protein